MSSTDETTRLVNNDKLPNTNIPNRANSQPIPANRLALDAQIQAAAEYQRRLKRRRSIYYILLITSVTMITFFILSFVAWIVHNGSGANGNLVQSKDLLIETTIQEEALNEGTAGPQNHLNHFNARKHHPTRTIKSSEEAATLHKLLKRSEMESDEEKDEEDSVKKGSKSKRPTRTRKLSFAPEKVIDYKAKI